MSCRGCHSRLELGVGSSGFCDPCYLAGKVLKVVYTRYPTSKARELTSYLAKVLSTLEADCELFEADRTAGIVDAQGYLIEAKKPDKLPAKQVEKAPGQAALASGEHPGTENAAARPSKAVKEEIKEPSKRKRSPSVQSRSRRRRKRRSQSRKEEKKRSRGSPSPVVVEEQAEVVGTEPEAEEEVEPLEEEEEELQEPEDQDDEVIRNPQKFELRQTAKPSSRKPLPRRPRTPSVSPPGYHSREPAPIKRWKGWAHVYRGQERQSKGKGKGGKNRPPKGQAWHRR